MKYRLYDIDAVISKTFLLGAMAALITATYVVVVVGLGSLFEAQAGSDTVLSLVGTALVAVAFEPVRRRMQRLADRLVHGDRLSPYETLARFSDQLSRGDHHPELFTGLASSVADGVQAAQVTLWVGDGHEVVAVATWPPRDGALSAAPRQLASLGDTEQAHVRHIRHRGVVRGAVTLTRPQGDLLTASEDKLLQDLVAQAGLVIDNAGLGIELQQRLQQIAQEAAELKAAAKRLVGAQYAARRRMERDLHDGAQQRLVTLALTLRSVEDRATATGDAGLASTCSWPGFS